MNIENHISDRYVSDKVYTCIDIGTYENYVISYFPLLYSVMLKSMLNTIAINQFPQVTLYIIQCLNYLWNDK